MCFSSHKRESGEISADFHCKTPSAYDIAFGHNIYPVYHQHFLSQTGGILLRNYLALKNNVNKCEKTISNKNCINKLGDHRNFFPAENGVLTKIQSGSVQ
ncbi:hypothetical protein ATANTOWER_030362 [Ataeniobius toweri]|uniref:Uncharacterized protein n=1 Tax=Ataeniobius toweri TaxID=208326 RepID=A0ABU7B2S4_9TELE|nr:hypothetical protein [Ataeniobius toweri]